MKMYAVKNDEGSWLGNEGGILCWSDLPTTFDTLEANRQAKRCDAHVVELVEPEKVVLTERQAEIVKEAHYSNYPATYIGDNTDTQNSEESLLMRAYVNGYTVEKPKRWNVKVPHTKYVWYYKPLNADLRTISNKELCSEFTESDIEHYDLQDCEKEEVTDDEQ